MKQLRIATTCLLMLLVAHQRTIAADTLHIECNTKAIKKFLRNDLTKANTTCVVLSGYDKRTNWNKVFKKLGTLPALSELMLLSNNLNKLPESAVALKKLEHLTVIGSSDAWLEESIDVLLRMNALHHLTCELEYEDELPFELLHAPTLRQVTCISPMFEDFHIGWQKALSDTGLYIYSINLERTGDLQSIGPLSVSIIWPDAPEDEDAMQAVEVAADETANGESTAEDQTATSALKDDDAEFVAATRISAPTNGFDPEYKTLHRPVPDIDTHREYYAVDCSKRTVIFTERSNTQIDIPANAFVDKQGNAVQGDVQVDYREFRDPVDFLFSGIPMSFGDSTNQTFFRSAGMFEINASQNGNEVFLQDDKDITVNFADTDTA
ncbi:MAG: hypothetical protein ACKVOR_14240, partial [Flavobacteriales bacterium]